jgi:precorrin-6B methylase 2
VLDAALTIFSIFIVFLFFVIGLGIWVLWTSVIGAPWVPTSRARVRKILELAQVTENDVVMDLGSGDGRIPIIAAKEYGARSIGIEIDPLRVFWSRMAIRRRGLKSKAKVIRGNFFSQNLADATVVTIYQTTDVNKQLKEKLSTELKPGTRVVSNSFEFVGWTPKSTTKKPDLYLYIM